MVRQSFAQEADRGGGPLVGEYLDVGQARGVIDADISASESACSAGGR